MELFAEDVYPLDPLRDFGEQADEFRALYPECRNATMEELTNQVEFSDSWVNRFPGHILQFRVGFIFPIGSKKE